MKQLKTGTFSNKQIAEWFGYKDPHGFYYKKQDKLNELSNYCDFEITDTGKIKIKNVLISEYVKPSEKIHQYYLEEVPKVWKVNEIETCKRVADKIYKEDLGIEKSTGYYYTRKVRDELWGKPSTERVASCRYMRAKMYREPELHYIPLTKEENKEYLDLYSNFFVLTPDEMDKIHHLIEEGEITMEEVQRYIFPKENYRSFLQCLSHRLNCDWIVLGTYVEVYVEEESAF